MRRTKGNLIELFVDKAVLAVAAIAALVILFFFVIGSPNAIKYTGQKLAPGKIDKSIYDRAVNLQEKLKEEPQDSNSYKPRTPVFASYIKNAVKDVNVNISFPVPHYSTETDATENRIYPIPAVGQVANPLTAIVTMAAYVPTEELSDALTYQQAQTELADTDLVTVESSINAQQLYESFNAAFTGKNIPKEWRIEQYAKPVFAKVELQRRVLQEDGSWNQWAEVPKTKIYYLNKTVQIPAQTNEYEIQIALVQFGKPEIRNEALQPPVYDNAIPAKPWLCPSFYNERKYRLEKEQEELDRQRLETERAEKLQGRSRSTTRRSPSGMSDSSEDESTTPSSRTRTTRTAEPSGRPLRKTPDSTEKQTLTEEDQFKAIKLADQNDLAALEKLVFWAHDDTTKPGEKYQYRIRIGVINPIAGKKNWFSQEQKDLAGQVLLFSDFSKPTDTIEIPRRIHFFAINSREIKRDDFIDRTVDVKVARYTLGNWVTKIFNIKNGDKIGTVINTADTRLKQANVLTESIDLSTGFVMVDSRRVTKWTGKGFLKSNDVDELLYCKTGGSIQAMPIKERFWPEEILNIYKEIELAEKAEPIALVGRGTSSSVQKYSSPALDRASPGSGRGAGPGRGGAGEEE